MAEARVSGCKDTTKPTEFFAKFAQQMRSAELHGLPTPLRRHGGKVLTTEGSPTTSLPSTGSPTEVAAPAVAVSGGPWDASEPWSGASSASSRSSAYRERLQARGQKAIERSFASKTAAVLTSPQVANNAVASSMMYMVMGGGYSTASVGLATEMPQAAPLAPVRPATPSDGAPPREIELASALGEPGDFTRQSPTADGNHQVAADASQQPREIALAGALGRGVAAPAGVVGVGEVCTLPTASPAQAWLAPQPWAFAGIQSPMPQMPLPQMPLPQAMLWPEFGDTTMHFQQPVQPWEDMGMVGTYPDYGCELSWDQGGLIAALMPEACQMDPEQLAAQLRAAAPERYED